MKNKASLPTIIQDILTSPVYDIAVETPVTKAEKLSLACNTTIFLKREDLQPVHSFKIRGAYHKMSKLSKTQKTYGVISASAGNHAQGVAMSSHRLNIPATIVMPQTTPDIKVQAVERWGASVCLFGDSYSDAYEKALELQKKTKQTFIHPFDDANVIAGQGTIGREILEQLPNVTHIFVPIGGGGLIAGVAYYIKTLKSSVKIIGVEPDDSAAMLRSVERNRRILLNHVGIFADGVAVKQVGKLPFKLTKRYVDDILLVSNDEICSAIKNIFEETRSVVEPAGALGVAGAKKYWETNYLNKSECSVAICSGSNLAFERLQFIAERTLIGSKNEVLYAVTLSERPGTLKEFCKKVVNGHNITSFSYRLDKREYATIFIGLHTKSITDKDVFVKKLVRWSYAYVDLSDDNIAKEHVRHMIGGKSNCAQHEYFYEVTFPERPSALIDFLSIIQDRWNISLFHYRGQGSDRASVMVGFEAKNKLELEKALKKTTYEFNQIQSYAVNAFLKG